jgi:G3E family GTPase
MSSTANKEDKPIPVTIVNGFLGAGKTTMILSLLEQLSAGSSEEASDTGAGKYQVVWLKNEFGVNEVDSLLAEQSSIASVKEILNGCLCCTLVGRLSDALQEILASVSCDRIIIETSGSAYAAPLAQEVNRYVDRVSIAL